MSVHTEPRTAAHHDGRGADAAVADLDEEMEKVFAMADEDRFDVARLAASPDSSSTAASKRSYGEKDYALHRKKSYQHMHPPLKHLHSHSLRRKMSSPEGAEGINIPGAGGEGREMRKASRAGTDSDTAQSPSTRSPTAAEELPRLILSGSASPEEERDETILSSESEPQVSERAASFGDSPIFGSPTDALRRVQFQIGEIAEKPEEGSLEDADQQTKELLQPEEPPKEVDKKPKRRHSRHHYHHHRSRKHSLQEDPQSRLRSGAEFSGVEGRRVSIQPEEAINLQEQDIDDLASHRFDDARGLRRYKLQKTPSSGLVHIGRKDGSEQLQSVLPLQAYKKMFDHSPHEVFVQLDELYGEGEDREWKETARWIKYEEDVEEGADRWGRPHVASLSFHSLLNLRRCLETGVVLLDLEERDLPGVAYRVVEQMVIDELIEAEDKPTVMRALLLRHRHVNDHDKFRLG